MQTPTTHKTSDPLVTQGILSRFQDIRAESLKLVEGLSDADTTVQSMPDASPAKWHLAHTTWFFEAVILNTYVKDYENFDNSYHFLFNSYYEALGPRHQRPRRGLLTRPTLADVIDYRAHVEEAMGLMLSHPDTSEEVLDLLELGINHEQQHQELLLTDLLHLFAQNPLNPEYRPPVPLSQSDTPAMEQFWHRIAGGVYQVGHNGDEFAFDCEGPRHDALIHPFGIANRPITNREWVSFIEDGGYETPLLWLSDGWATSQSENWAAPSYWEFKDDQWWAMSLRGFQPVNNDAPVSHISYYEADAYARWAGYRLPTEFEWEIAASETSIDGQFAGSGLYRPLPAQPQQGLSQMFGDVWEWTASAYSAYPQFVPKEGVAAEYNGKFMSGQYVLKGGSCVTPAGHVRASYRNFFYPHQRWQFSGLRLARNI
jgi:ergothioneine biosynthesis protein EgtB